MKCPACPNELTVKEVGSLKVDVCEGGCGGIWFDAFELQQVDEEKEIVGAPLLHIRRDEQLDTDMLRKRACPRCPDIKLKRRLFNPKSRVEVDECPNCGGYWLDHGELARIREERRQSDTDHLTKAADDTSISSEFIRYLYQMRTGHNKQRPF